MKNQNNPAILRSGMTIGSIDAENDDAFLFECFVKKYDLNTLLDCNSPYSVILEELDLEKLRLLNIFLMKKRNQKK